MTRREAVATLAITPAALASAAELIGREPHAPTSGPDAGTPVRADGPALLIVFSSKEGQTRGIAEFLSERFRRNGCRAEMVEIGSYARHRSPAAARAVLVAASIHFGRHDGEVARFVAEQRALLGSVPTAFLSVSLSAAQPAKRADADGYVRAFLAETEWRPSLTHTAAGALRYTRYGFLKRMMMRKIAEQGGLPTDTSRDHEFTDWKELAAFGDAFLSRVGAPV